MDCSRVSVLIYGALDEVSRFILDKGICTLDVYETLDPSVEYFVCSFDETLRRIHLEYNKTGISTLTDNTIIQLEANHISNKLTNYILFNLNRKANTCALSAEDYQGAIEVQNACNLSGVVYSFARVMEKICKEAEMGKHGTDWKNNHPICRMYAEQIYHLTREKNYNEAYNECEKLSSK